MAENNVWRKAQSLQWQVSEHITPGFDIGFDQQIPTDTQNELRSFVKWVEQNYRIPITLWVDFEYKHYLVRRDGKRVGYLFYWSDILSYPVFDCKEDIPVIRLPVRTEHSSVEEILSSFIEAITDYYAWLCQELTDEYIPDGAIVESILREYLKYRKSPASA
ncbi:MAG: hypothetical protein IJ281_08220 [Clostridia bacterium]|nr:hypothetical protein [Clostridia bacterium]